MVLPRVQLMQTAHRFRHVSNVIARRARFTTSPLSSYEQALQNLPHGVQIHLDFFGEPITFVGVENAANIENTVAALDRFEIGLTTRGKAFTGGGEEHGVSIQAAHSTALAWADILRHATVWNSNDKLAPMLAHIAVAPLLVQTGINYAKDIDHLLSQVPSGIDGVPPLQMLSLAQLAADERQNETLDIRERTHLKVLHCLLRHQHKRALAILGKHLQGCPGDGLALSLLVDLAHVVGDKKLALMPMGSVAAYWNERQGSLIRPGIPGHSAVTSLIALGVAVGGRNEVAERLALQTIQKGEKLAGGTASWALAHIYDSEGRTAEGISAFANTDGILNFESCGLLFFDSILTGYGVRFALDREERGRGRSPALRLYDNAYERVLDSNVFGRHGASAKQIRKAPVGWQNSSFKTNQSSQSLVSKIFPTPAQNDTESSSQNDRTLPGGYLPVSLNTLEWNPSCEDVLTWIPPTPQFLSDATLILFRLTLNGTISCENYRWENLKNAWTLLLENHHVKDTKGTMDLGFYPLASIAASLLVPEIVAGRLSGAAGRLARAIHKMGVLLNLGETSLSEDDSQSEETGISKLFVDIVADKSPEFWLPTESPSEKKEWKEILRLLSSVIDGVLERDEETDAFNAELLDSFETWEFDARPFIDHATVYAACKCGDYESLSLARSICSRGVTFRPNSPEEWWRYSIVLGLLGDAVASEDALNASLSFGGGQGVRHD